MKKQSSLLLGLLAGIGLFASSSVNAACWDVPYYMLERAANAVRAAGNTGGLNLDMWATIVDETGKVCGVVNTGPSGAKSGNTQWLGSRIISAQKANTANAFSLNGLSISTGALYAAVQPGGSLFGLQASNPVDASIAYQGNPNRYGTYHDPIAGKRVGGVNVFGGGLALYKNGEKIGAIGVSGDTSCTDHAFAWSIRKYLGLEPSGDVAQVEKLSLKQPGSALAALGDHPGCAATDSAFLDGDFGYAGVE